MRQKTARKVWIDLDNSPHVPFFAPIIRELERKGYAVIITTRDCFQVRGLADQHRLRYREIGRHYGANKILKVLGTVWRCAQLAPSVIGERPVLSMSHGSRPLILLSSLLRIPTILLFDYEHCQSLPFIRPELGMAPEAIKDSGHGNRFKSGLRVYPGLKEDVYVSSFTPDPSICDELALNENDIVATIRPPATEAHYHNRESEELFVAVVNFLATEPRVRMVMLPRNEQTQRDFVLSRWPSLCEQRRIIIPDRVLNGLNLIWHSDLVVSGGGTMNREAAALGVPVYSIFRGKLGAVDRYLADTGRLTLIQTQHDIAAKIRPTPRVKQVMARRSADGALQHILAAAEEMLGAETRHLDEAEGRPVDARSYVR
jgi:uncharacterized protein